MDNVGDRTRRSATLPTGGGARVRADAARAGPRTWHRAGVITPDGCAVELYRALEAALAEAGPAVDAYLTGDGSRVRAVPVSRGSALGRSPR